MKSRVHINLTVTNLEASVDFYKRLFGVSPTKRRDDYANWRLDNPALHLALVHVPAAAPVADPESRHFGIELFDDSELEGWQKRVQKAGLKVRTEEQVTCCYAVANKFWAADPEGNEWEFWVRHEEAESMFDAENAPARGEACCGASAEENTQAQAAGSCCAAGAAGNPKMTTATQEKPGKTSCCG